MNQDDGDRVHIRTRFPVERLRRQIGYICLYRLVDSFKTLQQILK